MRRRARDAPAAEAADEDEKSFQDEVLFMHLDVEVEIEVGVEAGHSQARVFTLTPQDVQASNVVVASTLSICSCEAHVLIDPGASHSFISPTLLREWRG